MIQKFQHIIIILVLSGCASVQSATPVCRHTSLMCALVYQEKGNQVKIDTGHSTIDKTALHAQAKVNVAGEWQWIRFNGISCEAKDGNQEEFTPERSYTPDQFYRIVFSKDWR